MTAKKGFYVAPFVPQGQSQGVGFWELDNLSPRWLETCTRFLLTNGAQFSSPWGLEISHIETELSSRSGAAMGAFYAEKELVLSSLYLSGTDPQADDEVLKMFIGSLNKSQPTDLTPEGNPFGELSSLQERPLAAFVIWGNPEVAKDDVELIRELGIHLAGAFFELAKGPRGCG